MGKGKDAKKNVKKVAAKTPKEKKAEKRLNKNKQACLRKKTQLFKPTKRNFLTHFEQDFRFIILLASYKISFQIKDSL